MEAEGKIRHPRTLGLRVPGSGLGSSRVEEIVCSRRGFIHVNIGLVIVFLGSILLCGSDRWPGSKREV